ncbi:MAG: recombinase family protein [Cutibacterium avidum]|nr:recombinase family protein [Cutibacterium avidum]
MSTNQKSRKGVAHKAKTCFLYVRVSTKMQVENGESIEAQLYDLRAYVKRENLRVLHEYIDDGYSGKNITGRPHFQEMMEEIKSGVHVDYVLVFKLSRFGRNAADALSSLQLMQDFGTNLVYVKDGINSEAQMGKMMIAFMSAFAEMERENILVQTMAGREQKAREGKWNGGQAPYGYKLVKDEKGKGHLEIDESEAEIVRIIFHEYTKNGKGVMALASWLNAQGYRKTVRGNGQYEHFVPAFLKNVLRNPVYAGKIAFGRRRTTPVKGKRNEYRVVKQSDYDV